MPEAMLHKSVLLITPDLKETGGREQLSGLLLDSLRSITGNRVEVFRLTLPDVTTSIHERLVGRINGITAQTEAELLKRVSQTSPDCIFIDGSNLGRLARLLSRSSIKIPIITFYHNVEASFFFAALRAAPTARALGVLIANTIAERWAARYSQRRVLLNERDARLHALLYRSHGTDVVPLVIRDKYDPAATRTARPWERPYALFVGGGFYANVEGMAWYAENVAPYSPFDTIVIGRGMATHRSRLERWGGVHVVGAVDDLATWYHHATIVIAPVFSGSGMKTKTAEALMHGKPVIGTPEAFVGYRMGWSEHLKVCEDEEQFLSALKNAIRYRETFNGSLRAHYKERHSEQSMCNSLVEVLRQALRDKAPKGNSQE